MQVRRGRDMGKKRADELGQAQRTSKRRATGGANDADETAGARRARRRPLGWLAVLTLFCICGTLFFAAGGPAWSQVRAGALHRVKGAPPWPPHIIHVLPQEAWTSPGDLNVLLLGSDRRTNGDPSWRTDTIIIAAIRPQAKMIALFSIPRDLWVTIPGHGEQRINTADYTGEQEKGPGGGPALVAAILQQNLGIHVDAYARINFEGLEKVIDALGGVTVTLTQPFDDTLDDPQGGAHIHLSPGPNHLDGRTALAYARSRRTSNDLDRCRRQQQVLLAMRSAAARPAVILQLPKLLLALPDVVNTNLQPSQILSLANLALRVDPSSYRTRIVDETMVRDWVTPGGAMVLLPDYTRIRQAWLDVTTP